MIAKLFNIKGFLKQLSSSKGFSVDHSNEYRINNYDKISHKRSKHYLLILLIKTL